MCVLIFVVRWAERILQLICVQTKPVQVYRITAREALPPPGLRALSRVHAASISAASTSYRDLHGDVDSQVEADSVDDTDSNDDVDVDGGGGGRVGSNLKGNVTNANLINSGDEADDAAAAVAMAAAERIFGEDEEDMEVLASDEPISNISNSISSTNSSSGSSTSSLAVGKERCGVSHIGGPGVAKREKVGRFFAVLCCRAPRRGFLERQKGWKIYGARCTRSSPYVGYFRLFEEFGALQKISFTRSPPPKPPSHAESGRYRRTPWSNSSWRR